MNRRTQSNNAEAVKKLLVKHLTKVQNPNDMCDFTLEEKGENPCKKRIKRGLVRLAVEIKSPKLWTPAICRHVAEFILRRAMIGDTCSKIADQLLKMGALFPPERVQEFLDSALKQGDKKYTADLFHTIFVGTKQKKLKNKPGPKQDLRTNLIEHLAWIEEGAQIRIVVNWYQWPLQEILFYLQTGIVPPNCYRIDKSSEDFVHQLKLWNERCNRDWFKKVNVVVRSLKQNDIFECIEIKELLDEKPPCINHKLRSLKIRASDEYIRKVLQYHGYRWTKYGKKTFQHTWNYSEDKDKSKVPADETVAP